VLPYSLSQFVKEAATAIGCDDSLIACPLLAALAGCIGATRQIAVKDDWRAPAVLWTGVVVDSGQQKTPAQSAVTRSLHKRQGRDIKAHVEKSQEHQRALSNYEAALSDWKRTKGVRGEPPEKPPEPICKRILISDPTIEAVADRLQDNPRGLFLDRDELSGWLGSYDQYRAGKGSDVAHWLSCYNAKEFLIDRKSTQRKTIYVERAAVSVTGGIQPRTLARMLGKHHFENGLAARFGFAMPPRRKKVWRDSSISEDAQEALEWIYDQLLALTFGQDADGNPEPIDVPLSPDGKDAYIAFYDVHNAELAELSGDLAALWAKLEETAARIALVMHCVRSACGDQTLKSEDAIDGTSIQIGVTLARWFANEGRRIYSVLAESDEECERRRLFELIQAKGGRIVVDPKRWTRKRVA
jgi:hypothetical protein